MSEIKDLDQINMKRFSEKTSQNTDFDLARSKPKNTKIEAVSDLKIKLNTLQKYQIWHAPQFFQTLKKHVKSLIYLNTLYCSLKNEKIAR